MSSTDRYAAIGGRYLRWTTSFWITAASALWLLVPNLMASDGHTHRTSKHTAAHGLSDSAAGIGGGSIAQQLAPILINDDSYDQLTRLLSVMLHQAMREGGMPRLYRRAFQEDETRYYEALTESVKIAIPRQAIEAAYAHALQQHFSSDELLQLLSFMRTQVGQRYLSMLSDAEFNNALWTALPSPDRTGLTAIMIGQFHRQFPKMGFNKRVPR